MPKHQLLDPVPERGVVAAKEAPTSQSWRHTKILKGPRRFLLATVVLVACFSRPLYDLARYAAHSDLYSHILLIPFISLYLVWLKKVNLALGSAPARSFAVFPLMAGVVALAGYWTGIRSGWQANTNDYLALTVLSFLLFLAGAGFLFLGKDTMRAVGFPMALLLFMAPFPTFLRNWIDVFFQHGSAAAAYAMLNVSGTPVLRQGFEFHVPGITMAVAPECSGIHSSLVLLITSLLAGQLFLRSPWKRAVLTLAVIPLAIVRNGLRIFTIAQLCIHISPDMINSYIHRRGGPIFFILSLVPFFLLLIILRKSEQKNNNPTAALNQKS